MDGDPGISTKMSNKISGYPRGPIDGPAWCPRCKAVLPMDWKRCSVCGHAKNAMEAVIYTVLFVLFGLPLTLISVTFLFAFLFGGNGGGTYDFVIFLGAGFLGVLITSRMVSAFMSGRKKR